MSANLLQNARTFALQRDKQQHFAVCFFLTAGFLMVPFTTGSIVAIVTAIGLAKELWDRRYGTGFCWYDMLANGLGLATGLALLLPFTI
ncbi:MAG: hypothetical protein MH219_20415 [Marinobacter sp.]|jgi:hypothetical protein|nr:hypothetical protein [Marinobacter sp.]MCL1481500.1 hypothetical protein [Marinobacter sp.]